MMSSRAPDDTPCDRPRRHVLARLAAWAPLVAAGGWAGVARAARAAAVVRIGGTGSAVDVVQRWCGASGFRDLELSVVGSLGSTGGLRALDAGRLDVAMSSRPLTPAEQARGLVAHEVFRSPFVWAVAASSGLTGLALGELIDIYAGRRTHWPDGGQIRPVLRPENDSDTIVLRSLHPELSRAWSIAQARPGMRVAMTDADAVDDLRHIPGALGTTTLGLAMAEGSALRALALDGVTPSVPALAQGRWRLSKVVYLVVPQRPSAGASRLLHALSQPAAAAGLARLGQWAQRRA